MLDQLTGFHIEPTNMCTLKCPRCPRTQFIKQFKTKNWHNQNLNLDHLKQFLDIDIKGLTFHLNGNDGDPIYYPQLFELIIYIKSNGGNIIIHTNGSYQSQNWWKKLGSLLDNNDIVNFSIDGTPSNFTNYRINADWPSIEQGIKILVDSPAWIVWKYIIFSYNETTIDEARKLSQTLKMDDFVLNNSDRWEENDWLKPNNYANIIDTSGIGLLYNGSHIGGRDKNIISWKTQDMRSNDIDPFCKKTNSSHYISSQGYYLPCCWAGVYKFYYKNDFYKNKDLYDISKTKVTQLLTNLQNFYNTLEETKLDYCTFNCSKI